MAGHSSGTDTYYVPEQSPLAICMATSVAVLILGVAAGMNALSYQQNANSLGW